MARSGKFEIKASVNPSDIVRLEKLNKELAERENRILGLLKQLRETMAEANGVSKDLTREKKAAQEEITAVGKKAVDVVEKFAQDVIYTKCQEEANRQFAILKKETLDLSKKLQQATVGSFEILVQTLTKNSPMVAEAIDLVERLERIQGFMEEERTRKK